MRSLKPLVGTLALTLLGMLAAAIPAAATDQPPAPRTIDIKVSNDGYQPARIEMAAGEKVRLAFHSETDSECQGTVKSADLAINPTRLPKGKTTVIEVTAPKAGEYSFACAMGMIRGSVIVKGS